MFRFSHRSCGGKVYPSVLGFLGFELKNQYDDDSTVDTTAAKKFQEETRLKIQSIPSGWEGLKKMYSKQEPYGLGMELLSCIQLGLCSGVTGFVYGGIENTKFTVTEFKERNQATMYKNTFEAQRSLQDKVSKDFFKGGYKMGLKCGSFLFCYSIITTSLSVYRGKTSISDFAIGGFTTGALYTANRGLLGAFSGGLVGTVLGGTVGLVTKGALYAANIDINEVRMWQHYQYEKRVASENKAFVDQNKNTTEHHDRLGQLILRPEEAEKGRYVDKLETVVTQPKEVDVIIPLQPPPSVFRKEDEK